MGRRGLSEATEAELALAGLTPHIETTGRYWREGTTRYWFLTEHGGRFQFWRRRQSEPVAADPEEAAQRALQEYLGWVTDGRGRL